MGGELSISPYLAGPQGLATEFETGGIALESAAYTTLTTLEAGLEIEGLGDLAQMVAAYRAAAAFRKVEIIQKLGPAIAEAIRRDAVSLQKILSKIVSGEKKGGMRFGSGKRVRAEAQAALRGGGQVLSPHEKDRLKPAAPNNGGGGQNGFDGLLLHTRRNLEIGKSERIIETRDYSISIFVGGNGGLEPGRTYKARIFVDSSSHGEADLVVGENGTLKFGDDTRGLKPLIRNGDEILLSVDAILKGLRAWADQYNSHRTFSVQEIPSGPYINVPEFKLFAKAGDGNQTVFTSGRQEITIRHCCFQFYADSRVWVVKDLGSTNGTKVNGRRIRRPTLLQAGDKIAIDGYVWIFGQEKSAHRGERPPEGPQARPAPGVSEKSAREEASFQILVRDLLADPPEELPKNGIIALRDMEGLGEVAATTDPWGEKINEDGVLMVRDPFGDLHLVILDGVGGLEDGEVATSLASEAYAEAVQGTGDPKRAYQAADQAVKEYNRQKFSNRDGAGTIAVSAKIERNGRIAFHWVGDARGSLFRRGPDGKLHLVYHTLEDVGMTMAVQAGGAALTRDVLTGERGDPMSFIGHRHMVVRETSNGLIPDPETEPGFRLADEFENGILLEEEDEVVLASDGLSFWKDVPGLIEGLKTAEEKVQVLKTEARHRMEILRQAMRELKGKFGPDPSPLARVPIQYNGKVKRLLDLQARGGLFIDRKGNVWDALENGNQVDYFRIDDFSVGVYVHRPRKIESPPSTP